MPYLDDLGTLALWLLWLIGSFVIFGSGGVILAEKAGYGIEDAADWVKAVAGGLLALIGLASILYFLVCLYNISGDTTPPDGCYRIETVMQTTTVMGSNNVPMILQTPVTHYNTIPCPR